jgi:hypothetical protein
MVEYVYDYVSCDDVEVMRTYSEHRTFEGAKKAAEEFAVEHGIAVVFDE